MDPATLQENITGVSHSGFYVDDLDRTIEFYTKVFGAKLAWRNDKSKNPLIKLYIGDFGLSIIKWPEDLPRVKIPHAFHWSYRVQWQKAEEMAEYIKSLGIEVEGPVGHKREDFFCNWFFLDPDGYRVEIEAKFEKKEDRDACVERNKAGRREDLGLYAGDAVLKT